jgi:hypothetical protein
MAKLCNEVHTPEIMLPDGATFEATFSPKARLSEPITQIVGLETGLPT